MEYSSREEDIADVTYCYTCANSVSLEVHLHAFEMQEYTAVAMSGRH